MSDFYQVSRADLEAINRAMNHMGDVLNGMDAVEEEDEAATEAGFKAIQAILASHPSNAATQDAPLSELAASLQFAKSGHVVSDRLQFACWNIAEIILHGKLPAPLFGAAATVPQVVQTPIDQAQYIEKLETIIGAAYQFAGNHDAPELWLDVLSDPAAATAEQVDGLLPYFPSAPQPVATSPSIVPSDEQIEKIIVRVNEGLLHCFEYGKKDYKGCLREEIEEVIGELRTLLTTASNAGEAAQGEE